ncbi:MAG: threonyl-tRNA synthetase [Saprospiraceae bacterium]|jgi:threonyl-tRNA synthetase
MPQVTLPDGSVRNYDNAISVHDVAMDIGPGLAKAALAGRINDVLVDTKTLIQEDSSIAIITNRDEAGLEVIRHSAAHLLAQAVKQLYPEAEVTIGPVIDNGFFYDFAYAPGFSETDLATIEKRMEELAAQDLPVVRSLKSREDAVAYFHSIGEKYKAEIIESIPSDEDLSLYNQGDFTDLCRGPHVPSTSHLKAFKLTKVAGAYWRGDSNNEMLQRIYGTAFPDKKQLKQYLHNLTEAEKRDHRKIGKQLDFFHLQEEAPGMVFWHPKGWQIYKTLRDFMAREQTKRNYKELNTPQVVDMSLWEASGHADKFGDGMFTVESEDRSFAIKPMNCPCHIQVFNQGIKSYRDLPLRFAEFGSCHRNELSGSLHGIMRVRGFVQDDGHIFCSEDQIQSEVGEFIDFLHDIYKTLGFTEVIYRLSTRPVERVGSDEVWDKAEAALASALNAKELPFEVLPGEGAFYGPKIEFSLKDCIGRVWQCGTMQVDFSMPGRLDASYIDENGDKQVPVMLHRALLGSFERFIGILIEHHEGKFPLWLAPEQVAVLTITDNQADYAQKVTEKLKNSGLRAICDLRNEKIGFKIREHTLGRIPYLVVVGNNEVENDQVSVRSRDGSDLGTMSLDALMTHLQTEGV